VFVSCRTLTPGHDPVQKVTIIPRGQARGLTWFTPGEDASLISKSQIFARIVGALGGRAAEEIIFGDAEVTTGAASDLQQVTGMAKQVGVNWLLFLGRVKRHSLLATSLCLGCFVL
jgi:cell division protease FtsH